MGLHYGRQRERMSGKGVSTALAISNAITNLCATAFGQLWRLEPLPSKKKSMWRREMECLLCVSDHIVELAPSWQTFPDGNKLEVMTCKPRSDLSINLPALCKLDNILVENVSENENEEREFLFSTGENNEEVVEENNEEGGEIDGKAEDNGAISVSECARDVCMEKFVYAKHEVMLPEKQSEFGGVGNGCSEKNIGSRFYSEQLLNIVDCC